MILNIALSILGLMALFALLISPLSPFKRRRRLAESDEIEVLRADLHELCLGYLCSLPSVPDPEMKLVFGLRRLSFLADPKLFMGLVTSDESHRIEMPDVIKTRIFIGLKGIHGRRDFAGSYNGVLRDLAPEFLSKDQPDDEAILHLTLWETIKISLNDISAHAKMKARSRFADAASETSMGIS